MHKGDNRSSHQDLGTEMEMELNQIKKSNETLLEKFKQDLETKVEEMLEKRIMEVSMMVANTVAGKITEALKTMLQTKLLIPSTESKVEANRESRTPPQVSPIKMKSTQRTQPDVHTYIGEKSNRKNNRKLSEELQQIDFNRELFQGPPHDKPTGTCEDLPS